MATLFHRECLSCNPGPTGPLRTIKKRISEGIAVPKQHFKSNWAECEVMEVVDFVLCILFYKSSSPRKNRLVLPVRFVHLALKECHDGLAGVHLKSEKTLQKIKTRSWQPGCPRLTVTTWIAIDGLRKHLKAPYITAKAIASSYHVQRLHKDIARPLPRAEREGVLS